MRVLDLTGMSFGMFECYQWPKLNRQSTLSSSCLLTGLFLISSSTPNPYLGAGGQGQHQSNPNGSHDHMPWPHPPPQGIKKLRGENKAVAALWDKKDQAFYREIKQIEANLFLQQD